MTKKKVATHTHAHNRVDLFRAIVLLVYGARYCNLVCNLLIISSIASGDITHVYEMARQADVGRSDALMQLWHVYGLLS